MIRQSVTSGTNCNKRIRTTPQIGNSFSRPLSPSIIGATEIFLFRSATYSIFQRRSRQFRSRANPLCCNRRRLPSVSYRAIKTHVIKRCSRLCRQDQYNPSTTEFTAHSGKSSGSLAFRSIINGAESRHPHIDLGMNQPFETCRRVGFPIWSEPRA